jgi:hypothetical protein
MVDNQTPDKEETKKSSPGVKGKDPGYDTLFTFVTVFSSLIYLLWQIREKLDGYALNIHSNLSEFKSIVANFLLFAIILIGAYVLFVIIPFLLIKVTYHGKNREDMSPPLVTITKELKKLIFGEPAQIITYNICIFLYGLMLIFNFLVFPQWLFIYTFGPLLGFVILLLIMKWFKHIILDVIFWILLIPFILVTIYVTLNMLMYLTSGYSVELDESQYFMNQTDVYVKIYPYGIYKPAIREVYYFTNETLLLNRTADYFRGSPTYLIIPKEKLTNASYNSFIVVWYNYGLVGTFLEPQPAWQTTLIPVFSPKIEITKRLAFLNNTVIEENKNDSTSLTESLKIIYNNTNVTLENASNITLN